jgi:Fic family protein
MTKEDKDILLRLLQRHKELGISEQIDYQKFYLYSIITHSTAIEGSTVTELEAQLLFDEGITSSKRTMLEQMMNLDLKVAYDYGREWIRQHEPITVDWLVLLASKEIFLDCMARHHCQHLQHDIDQFIRSTSEDGGQKTAEVDRKGGQKNSVEREQRKHAFILPSGRVLSKTRDAILDMIVQNAKITSTQMAESLGINRSAVSKHLKKMQADGIIRRVGPDKGGHWEVVEAEK